MMPGNDTVSEKSALLIVDLISDFSFNDGPRLFRQTLPMLENLASLRKRLRAINVPVIFVNDEIGQGRERLEEDLAGLAARSAEAQHILSGLRPHPGDHWIVKPQRSGFYATALGSLLLSLNVHSVIVTGVTTDICVLFTAHDAYMRGYSVYVPSDCCAAVEESHHEEGLKFLQRVAEANTAPSRSAQWKELFQVSEKPNLEVGSSLLDSGLLDSGLLATSS